ncbi:MAG TPA: hypothetical protein VK736_09905, partial [Candidatus Binatia bacterium]|nr:hypothetical protein [Candidatus Binatia bacterium]
MPPAATSPGVERNFPGEPGVLAAILPLLIVIGVCVRHPASVLATRLVRAALAVTLLAGLVTTPALAVEAPAGLTIEAKVLVDGHVRVGSWMAIDIHVANTGPAISGELRLAGGAQGRTRFGTRVDLPTQSDKTYRLYAQPPGFGSDLEISLVDGDRTVATTEASFTVHDATQLVVGIVAEQPGDIVGDLDLLPNQNSVAPLTVALTVADLPVRVEAWGVLDRLVWQDTDSAALSTEQIEALRGWVAGGGRLVIVGGTAGPSSLSAFPDALLPYRPTATTDVEPESLVTLLGELPDTATALPALTGELTEGRPLATAGDRTVAAERAYGSGSVTIVGFDPTASWIAGTSMAEGMWRGLIPTRASGGPILGDDSQIVSAASQLPSLALPPIGGLIGLLGAYILLIGPINYLVLRRLDRREWAWITMPILIVAFAAGAYGFGSLLRGSDLIVNEVAIVRGSPGTTEGTAQIYLGVFSPSRGTYQLRVPGGALLSSPTNGNFEGNGNAASLDVLQGDPAQVRDLGVGFGSLRTVRAETAIDVPLVQAQLRLENGRLKGTVTNASNEVLLKPAVVLGGTVARLSDLAPGASDSFDVAVQAVQMGQSMSDRIVGPTTFGDSGQAIGEGAARINARHAIMDQLTFDPNMGFSGQLPAEGPVVLAWADHTLLPVEIEGAEPRREANVLWFLPTEVSISGKTLFRNDLLRSTVISSDANFFSKDPFTINFGRGTAELSYRPIAFEGTIEASELAIGLNFGEPGFTVDPKPIEPLPSIPPACEQGEDNCLVAGFEGIPEVEFYDLTAAAWKRLPHL